MTSHDDYGFWRSALVGNFGPIHDGDAQCGFYRKPVKNGVPEPVAIWRDTGGELRALVGGRSADPTQVWTWVCRSPVTEADYRAVSAGGHWPDLAPGVAPPSTSDRQNASEADQLSIIRDQIDAAKTALSAYASIVDDTMCAAAQSARARLLELSREADKIRDVRKRPHLEAGKAIDAEWQPLVKDAKAAADQIANAMSAYETAKARKAEAERRRREEEAREAAKAAPPQAPAPVATPGPEPAAMPIKGAYGRAASVKVVQVATVVDQDAAYAAMRTHPELVELIARLAQRAVNSGHVIPGVEVSEERRVA